MLTLNEVLEAMDSKEQVWLFEGGVDDEARSGQVLNIYLDRNLPPKVKLDNSWHHYTLDKLYKSGDPELADALKNAAAAKKKFDSLIESVQSFYLNLHTESSMYESLQRLVVEYESGLIAERPVLCQGPEGILLFADDESYQLFEMDPWYLLEYFGKYGAIKSISLKDNK